jgi:hypothetical protein
VSAAHIVRSMGPGQRPLFPSASVRSPVSAAKGARHICHPAATSRCYKALQRTSLAPSNNKSRYRAPGQLLCRHALRTEEATPSVHKSGRDPRRIDGPREAADWRSKFQHFAAAASRPHHLLEKRTKPPGTQQPCLLTTSVHQPVALGPPRCSLISRPPAECLTSTALPQSPTSKYWSFSLLPNRRWELKSSLAARIPDDFTTPVVAEAGIVRSTLVVCMQSFTYRSRTPPQRLLQEWLQSL